MSSFLSKSVNKLAAFAQVSKSFENKIKIGKDHIATKCPKPSKKSYVVVDEVKFNGKSIFYFNNINTPNNKCVIYLHGGAFLTNFSLFHWRFIIEMAQKAGSQIVAPDYPLAPKYYYKDVFEMIYPLYLDCIEKHGAENVVLMGDSAGGGLALSLAQKAKSKSIDTPSQIILLSPWIDLTCSNKEIDAIEKNDPLLTKKSLIMAAKAYSRGDDTKNFLLSPLFGELDKIGKISVFTGTYDILNADAKMLLKISKEKNIEINYFEVEEMMHVWMLIGIFPESKQTRKQIFEMLK